MDLYEILGVKRGAASSEIRRAYRRLARMYHPGLNPGDPEAETRFAQITLAFETLNDAERRRAYDAGALPPATAERVSYGFEGFDFSVEVSSEHRVSTFGDLFGDILAGGLMRRADAHADRGADLHATMALAFEESMRGADRHLPITRQVRCRTCAGAGVLRVDPMRCLTCHGTGRIRSARGHMVFSKPCEPCGATGQQDRLMCRTCQGQGTEARVEAVHVQLPPGVADGAQVRLPAAGHAGRKGGPPGDLYLTVRVEVHPLYRREGQDLHMVVPVALHEAALGAKLEVPAPDGVIRLRVPPGTQSGQRLRVRERGVPSPRDGTPGDLIVEVRLVLPPLLDERSKALLREFGAINGEDVRQGLWPGRHEP